MEHKSLIIKIENGEVTDLLLKANLNETYRSLFTNACRAARRKPNAVEHGVRIVIFGAFWLEAQANELMRRVLELEIASLSVRNSLWDRLKRQPVLDKFNFFDSISPTHLHLAYEKSRLAVKDLFDLRNRLAHFKDDPELLSLDSDSQDSNRTEAKIEIHELGDIAKIVPVPPLNKRLMWPSTKQFAVTVRKASHWLTNVQKHSDKSHKMKSETVKLNKEKE